MALIRNNVIPVSYDRRQDAMKKELVYRYNEQTQTCDLFIVSPEDQSVLIDITENIRDKLDHLSGDTITVDIEGIGEISISEIIEKMTVTVNAAVKAIDYKNDISYVSATNSLDDNSLNIDGRHNIQIRGFNKADDNSMPVKRDGVIVWIPLISKDSTTNNDTTVYPGNSEDNNNTGGGNIIQPGNPTDGLGLKCLLIEPTDHRLYIQASKRQKSMFIKGNNKVILPTPFDEKSDIEWMVLTNDTVPTLTYPSNVFWKEIPTDLDKNTIHVFNFKTWDGGKTWAAQLDKYNSNADSEYITREYLEANYYNKNEVDHLISWEDGLDR